MPKNVPTSYGELADVLERLPTICVDTRRALGLSQRSAAAQIGIAWNTLGRFESKQDVTLRVALAILRWLGNG